MAAKRRRASRKGEAHAPAAAAEGAGGGYQAGRRLIAVDAIRGAAIVLMVAYHFCFDLSFFGLLRADFYHDPFWIGLRAFILSLFLLLVGVSLRLASSQAGFDGRFWKRLGLIAAAALLVSTGSYLVFPASYIHFGVLHCIAVSVLLARPLLRVPAAAAVLGVVVVIIGNTVAHPLFDSRALDWIGLRTYKPPTEDYVPVLPWAGVVFIGIGIGRYAPVAESAVRRHLGTRAPAWLALAGRHSLVIYLLHQPLLLGAIWLVGGA